MSTFWHQVQRWATNCFHSTPTTILAAEFSPPPRRSLVAHKQNLGALRITCSPPEANSTIGHLPLRTSPLTLLSGLATRFACSRPSSRPPELQVSRLEDGPPLSSGQDTPSHQLPGPRASPPGLSRHQPPFNPPLVATAQRDPPPPYRHLLPCAEGGL